MLLLTFLCPPVFSCLYCWLREWVLLPNLRPISPNPFGPSGNWESPNCWCFLMQQYPLYQYLPVCCACSLVRWSRFLYRATMVVTRALMKGARQTAARGATLRGALRCRWNNRKYRFRCAKKISPKIVRNSGTRPLLGPPKL